MANLLVTGGAGFIGANFVQYWLKEHPADRVVVLDALTYAGNLANLQSVRSAEMRFVHGSICDTKQVLQLLWEERITTIVHFAAESHVDRSIYGPDAFIEANVVGTHSLLKAARRAWLQNKTVPLHRFHHVSTDEVFGSLEPSDPAFCERSPYAPNSPYSASKAAADHLVRAYHKTYGLQVTTSNCSNNYGPYQFPEKLIPATIVKALHGLPLPVYGDGGNVRDWLHVGDHCRAIDLILSGGVVGEVYAIGGECECANIRLVTILCQVIDEMFARYPELARRYPSSPAAHGQTTTSLITFVTDRLGHDRRYAIDCAKIKHDLGYACRVPIEEGLRQTCTWYLENEGWWRGALDGEHYASERTQGVMCQ
jgi:dTDP-glucose 4,6-dehydratase